MRYKIRWPCCMLIQYILWRKVCGVCVVVYCVHIIVNERSRCEYYIRNRHAAIVVAVTRRRSSRKLAMLTCIILRGNVDSITRSRDTYIGTCRLRRCQRDDTYYKLLCRDYAHTRCGLDVINSEPPCCRCRTLILKVSRPAVESLFRPWPGASTQCVVLALVYYYA